MERFSRVPDNLKYGMIFMRANDIYAFSPQILNAGYIATRIAGHKERIPDRRWLEASVKVSHPASRIALSDFLGVKMTISGVADIAWQKPRAQTKRA